MFKTISAALLAVSVFAAPAFAANKTAPLARAPQVKASVLNANAKMGKHHHKYARHHHRHHAKAFMGTRTHAKVGFRHTSPMAPKRG